MIDKKLNKQEFFNTAYLGLASQGFLQSMGRDSCLYRGPNGLKCAIGHVLTDEEVVDQEFKCASAVLGSLGYDMSGDANDTFVDSLQECHDFSDSPENMKELLQELADRFSLTIPTI